MQDEILQSMHRTLASFRTYLESRPGSIVKPRPSQACPFKEMDRIIARLGEALAAEESKEHRTGLELRHVVAPFEVREVSESGIVTGQAVSYGNLDSYGTIIDPGASAKSLKASGGRVLLLADHNLVADSRIGLAYLTETSTGVDLRGIINIDESCPVVSSTAHKVVADLKFYTAHGYKLGLSIGFWIMKDLFIKGVRHLTEIDIVEVSVVSLGANDKAKVD